jgi:NADH-quinone oxidoreductase subunit L
VDFGGGWTSNWALRFDALTAVMLVVVNGRVVRWCISIPSAICIARPASSALLCLSLLFTFAMLMLVTADNLCSCSSAGKGWGWPLICSSISGSRSQAPMPPPSRRFLVNRVGDFGFALGIMGMFASPSVRFNFGDIFMLAKGGTVGSFQLFGYQV